MASVNKVIIVGNLGRDPDTRYLPNGDAITNASVATTDKWKDKNSGEQKEVTEWHRIAFFGRLAEIAGEYLKKGSQVYVEGSLRTRKWQDKDGKDRYSTEIRADVLQMLGSRSGQSESPPPGDARSDRPAAGAGAKKPAGKFDDMENDIPFVSCALDDDVIFRRLRWGHE